MLNTMSVSYTHLDVYKRQTIYSAVHVGGKNEGRHRRYCEFLLRCKMTNVEMVELEENVLIVVIFNFVVIGFIWFENVTYVFVSSSPIGSRSIGLPGHCYYDTRVISLITVRPVSYTHLDVYKRQLFTSPSTIFS